MCSENISRVYTIAFQAGELVSERAPDTIGVQTV